MKLSEVMHLVTSTGAFPVAEPSQWLLLGPVTMATSAVALAGLDTLARTLRVTLARRRVLLVGAAAIVWPITVKWGHPEDVLALGLCAMALSRSIEGRTVSAGWLLGGALAMQLYVVLAVPVFIGFLGVRRSVPLLARAALLPGAIFLALLIPNAPQTLHVLLDQPTPPAVNFATPWVLLAPHLGQGEVAGGPGRLFGFAGACGLGFLAVRRRHDAVAIVWLAAAALALRCLTEAVMSPYYVEPAIALAVLTVASRTWRRWTIVAVAGAALTVVTYHHLEMWWYWVGMAVPIAVMLVATWPRPRTPARAEDGAAPERGPATAPGDTGGDPRQPLALVVGGGSSPPPDPGG